MWATCITNRAADLADHQRGRTWLEATTYHLTPGRGYLVLGMSVTETRLMIFALDDTEFPGFYPAGLFDIASQPTPARWMFAVRDGMRASGTDVWANPVQAVWGYPELVEDPSHYTRLVEGEAAARDVFQRRLAEANLP